MFITKEQFKYFFLCCSIFIEAINHPAVYFKTFSFTLTFFLLPYSYRTNFAQT